MKTLRPSLALLLMILSGTDLTEGQTGEWSKCLGFPPTDSFKAPDGSIVAWSPEARGLDEPMLDIQAVLLILGPERQNLSEMEVVLFRTHASYITGNPYSMCVLSASCGIMASSEI